MNCNKPKLSNTSCSDLSTELVEGVVNEELYTVRKITIGISSCDAGEHNAWSRSLTVTLVAVLGLVHVDNCLKRHQHQNYDVVLAHRFT